jgi:hypothetical protein
MSTRSRVPLGTTARTGELCPESGVWEVVGSPSTTAPIAQGYGLAAVQRQGRSLAPEAVLAEAVTRHPGFQRRPKLSSPASPR